MPRADVDAATAAERLRLVQFLAGLTAEQWRAPSLCSAWTVAHVVAHLTVMTRTSIGQAVREAVRARGSLDRLDDLMARDRWARHSPDELVDLLRHSAGSTRRFPGSAHRDPLMDLVVHAQDIARPLGLTYVSPPDVVTGSLDHLSRSLLMRGPQRSRGLRFESTNSTWTRGRGPVVRGEDLDLLLALSGRPAGLDALEGEGVPTLRARLSA